MNRTHIAAAALAVAFLVTGCAASPATSNEHTNSTDTSSLLETGTATGSGGNVPGEKYNLLDCTETDPCTGSGGNVPAQSPEFDGSGGSGGVIPNGDTTTSAPVLVPGSTIGGSGGNVPADSPEFDGTGGSGGVIPN